LHRSPEDKRSAAQTAKIRDYFIEHALPANIAEARTRSMDAQSKRDAFYQASPPSWSWRKCRSREKRIC
jgi:hypothetical protein